MLRNVIVSSLRTNFQVSFWLESPQILILPYISMHETLLPQHSAQSNITLLFLGNNRQE